MCDHSSRPERAACIARRRSHHTMPCVGRIAHCRIECTAGSFDILDDAVTQMDRHAPPSSRGCSCMAIEAKIAAGRRSQGLMMYAGRIALQIARAAGDDVNDVSVQ